MKIKNAVFILIILVCFSFTTCNVDNPIISTWWTEEDIEPDYDYVAIIKNVPLLIYETIVEDHYIYETVEKIIYDTVYVDTPGETIYIERPLPPEILLQHIDIKAIEFIIFSGDQTKYNWSADKNAASHLTKQEQETNNTILQEMLEDLEKEGNEDYFLILHGHANPITGTAEETLELSNISNARAKSVRGAIGWVCDHDGDLPELYDPPKGIQPEQGPPNLGTPDPSDDDNFPQMDVNHKLFKRITTKGYGGGRNIAGSSVTYAGLNRRVEMILFTVSTDAGAVLPTPRLRNPEDPKETIGR